MIRVRILGTAPPHLDERFTAVEADAEVVLAEEPPEEAGGAPVVLLSDAPWSAELHQQGVRAILAPAATAEEIAAALEAVARGFALVSPAELAAWLPEPAAAEQDPLSPREHEVLRMLADGLANKEIAYRLSISEHTVKFHVASILSKLGVQTRTEAVTRGIRRGWIPL